MSAGTVAQPAARDRTAPHIRVIFAGLMLVMLLAALDNTIVATALPTIVGDLGGLEHLSWITSAYLLGQTCVIPLFGKLGDLLGRKRVLQSAVALFLAGSALCGLAQSMPMLIAFRAIQGMGAGGLIVLTQATIGDIVPPRERGRYQGLFGAVFGVASIGGPLLGGVIVEHVSWRWIFYVNLPVGAVALTMIRVTLPALPARSRPVIDYMGAALLAAGLASLVLVTSLGGTTWRWGSAASVIVATAAVALLAVFTAAERRAREPVVPLSLVGNRVFAVATTLSFIVGFALFGAVTFLPLFFQTVHGASPTTSGLRLAPMMGGLLVTSVLSGRLISRIGHYKAFPVIGTATVTLAMVLLSQLDVGTSGATSALYLLVLGLGLGSTMQVLVLAVQNAVDYKVLGSATSSVTLARGIGGSLGTAIFGAIFSARLRGQLHDIHAGALGRQMAAGVRLTGHQVASLPPGPRSAYEHAYVYALSPVFKVAAGVAAAGFLVSLLLEQRPLRATAATSQGLEDALAAPKDADSLAEIDRALSRLVSRERRRAFQARLAEMANVDVSPGAVWTLARFETYGPEGTRQIARDLGIEEERIAGVIEELRAKGMVGGDGATAQLTPAGRETAAKVVAARRRALEDALSDEASDRPPEVHALLERLSRELAGERP